MKKYFPLLLTFCTLVIACKTLKPVQSWSLAPISTQEMVGAAALPENIAPVKAPFRINQFEKPVFKGDTIRVALSEQGLNTVAIQSAIDKLSSTGGGTVYISKGKWLTGRIALKDNINLYIAQGAVLAFSGEIEDFLPVVFTRFEGLEVMSLGACIYANGASNIAVTGQGTLFGPADGSLRNSILRSEGQVTDELFSHTLPVSQRIVDGKKQNWILPPMFISPINCEKVYIEGVSLENTAFWNIVPIYCNNVVIRGVTVNSVGIPRGDGIDIESSRNVLIEYCTLSCGDDCFTMKSGRGYDGLRVNRPTENVVVRHCLSLQGHGGITCGSETAAMIKKLYVHDCVFIKSRTGIRFKTRRPRGGGGEDLTFERIRLTDMHEAIMWDMLGSETYVGEMARRFPARPVDELTPRYSGINIKDILVENTTDFLVATGIPESPVRSVKIENAVVNCSRIIKASDFRDAELLNMVINCKNPILQFDEVQNIYLKQIQFKGSTDVKLDVKGRTSDNISIKSSAGIKDTLWTR